MSSHGGAPATSDRPSSPQPKKPKSREVSSRFLSQAAPSAAAANSSYSSSDVGNQSPNSTLIFSPRQKHKQPPANYSRKHKSYENSGFFRGLWPSSSPNPSTIAAKSGDRSLTRQKSCTEFSRFDDRKIQISNLPAKGNQKPCLGGSMRYTEKPIKFDEKSDENVLIAPGRLLIDTELLLGSDELRNSGRMSCETPAGGKYSAASYMSPTLSSRKHGVEPSRSRRWSADSGPNQKPVVSSSECNNNHNSYFSSSSKVLNFKNATKKTDGNRAQSGSGKSKSSEEKGKMKSILSLGIGLLKGKKPVSSLSPFGPGSSYDVHQLKLLHNRLMQLRFINARAKTVNGNVFKQVEVCI
ncbi:QWRF motif-containing protein 3 [Striga hermonthica]|uniref:QWRF motif-containing protein 3 n=1 Tax=Striga hermonthica TaxID=68872 RepID=A0A9N7N7X8_STRHE|nr:QWRF motif-containing protein 3 [Striga hermonthica]